MTENVETPDEKRQSILGDLTPEEYHDILTPEIDSEIIRALRKLEK
jgi:hypothetical protein